MQYKEESPKVGKTTAAVVKSNKQSRGDSLEEGVVGGWHWQ